MFGGLDIGGTRRTTNSFVNWETAPVHPIDIVPMDASSRSATLRTSGAILTNAHLEDADLSGVYSVDANFSDAQLARWRMIAADLRDAAFVNADFPAQISQPLDWFARTSTASIPGTRSSVTPAWQMPI
jgi:hypothetical protein